MAHQLTLIETPTVSWALDEHTREIGREGLKKAREILASVPRRDDEDELEAPGTDTSHQSAA